MSPIFLAPTKSGGGTKRIKTASPFAPVTVVAKDHVRRTPLLSQKIEENYRLINDINSFFKKEFKSGEILGRSTLIGDQISPSFLAYPVKAKIFEDKENSQLMIALRFGAMGRPFDRQTMDEKREALDNAFQELLGKFNEYLKELGMGKAVIKKGDRRIKHSIFTHDQSRVDMWWLEGKNRYHCIFTINLP